MHFEGKQEHLSTRDRFRVLARRYPLEVWPSPESSERTVLPLLLRERLVDGGGAGSGGEGRPGKHGSISRDA